MLPERTTERRPVGACWECNRRFHGPFFTTATIGDGRRVYVHAECAATMERSGRVTNVQRYRVVKAVS